MRPIRISLTAALLLLVSVSLVLTFGFAQVNLGSTPSTPQTPQVPTASGTPSIGDLLSSPTFDTGVILGVGATLGIATLSLLFIGGTKFVNSENVLDSEARRQIYSFIREHPGTHLRATAQALELSTTNVLWHLRKLEGANLVNSRKFEGYKLFYPTEGGLESRRKAIARAVLKNENARDILANIADSPNTHQREIARALDVNHGTIRWHLRKLNEAGLVVQLKKEHTSNYWISEFGAKMLTDTTGKEVLAPAIGFAPAMAAEPRPLLESPAPAAATPAGAAPRIDGPAPLAAIAPRTAATTPAIASTTPPAAYATVGEDDDADGGA
ncbi:MAG: winged helix-turn-helix transcriptional regulator [Thermoplasmatota archaeon]